MPELIKTLKLFFFSLTVFNNVGCNTFLLVSTLMEPMIMSCHPILEMSVLQALSTDSASRFILLHLFMSILLVSRVSACVSFFLTRHYETKV